MLWPLLLVVLTVASVVLTLDASLTPDRRIAVVLQWIYREHHDLASQTWRRPDGSLRFLGETAAVIQHLSSETRAIERAVPQDAWIVCEHRNGRRS